MFLVLHLARTLLFVMPHCWSKRRRGGDWRARAAVTAMLMRSCVMLSQKLWAKRLLRALLMVRVLMFRSDQRGVLVLDRSRGEAVV